MVIGYRLVSKGTLRCINGTIASNLIINGTFYTNT